MDPIQVVEVLGLVCIFYLPCGHSTAGPNRAIQKKPGQV